MKSLNEIVAELRMGDDGGKPAYRIGRADKVEVSMPSGTPVRSYVLECVTIKELADWIEAAVAREREPGNAAAMRATLVDVKKSIDDIGASSLNCDPEVIMMSLTQVCARLSARIERALSAPARQCDVGTAKDQMERFREFCKTEKCGRYRCGSGCKATCIDRCALAWAQMPYEEKEGGAS